MPFSFLGHNLTPCLIEQRKIQTFHKVSVVDISSKILTVFNLSLALSGAFGRRRKKHIHTAKRYAGNQRARDVAVTCSFRLFLSKMSVIRHVWYHIRKMGVLVHTQQPPFPPFPHEIDLPFPHHPRYNLGWRLNVARWRDLCTLDLLLFRRSASSKSCQHFPVRNLLNRTSTRAMQA